MKNVKNALQVAKRINDTHRDMLKTMQELDRVANSIESMSRGGGTPQQLKMEHMRLGMLKLKVASFGRQLEQLRRDVNKLRGDQN